jgi:hypothetical protein
MSSNSATLSGKHKYEEKDHSHTLARPRHDQQRFGLSRIDVKFSKLLISSGFRFFVTDHETGGVSSVSYDQRHFRKQLLIPDSLASIFLRLHKYFK